jgi:hypothetical protein
METEYSLTHSQTPATCPYFGAQKKFFQKSRNHLKIIGARRVTRSEVIFRTPQILGAIIQNFVARANWGPIFVHMPTKNNSVIIHSNVYESFISTG